MTAEVKCRRAGLAASEFFQKTLDSLLTHIAVLGEDGTIVVVNRAWDQYASCNRMDGSNLGPGANYLAACDRAVGESSKVAGNVADGIRDLIAGRRGPFNLEYPCHSPGEQRWFQVFFSRFEIDGEVLIVVAHDNITERKLAEIKVFEANRALQRLAATDGLTGIANRRRFDEALAGEWERHRRDGTALSLAMLDVDCFKPYNDRWGHLAGDDCLRAIAIELRAAMRRPGDLVSRYGGEEFAMILPRTDRAGAGQALEGVVRAIRGLAIPHPGSQVGGGIITISIGAATTIPSRGGSAASSSIGPTGPSTRRRARAATGWSRPGRSGRTPTPEAAARSTDPARRARPVRHSSRIARAHPSASPRSPPAIDRASPTARETSSSPTPPAPPAIAPRSPRHPPAGLRAMRASASVGVDMCVPGPLYFIGSAD